MCIHSWLRSHFKSAPAYCFVRVCQLLDAVAAIRLPRAVSSAWQPFDVALLSAAAVEKWEAAMIALEQKAAASKAASASAP